VWQRADASAGATVLQQQARFDSFVHQFNWRPRQALDMATPASRYEPTARPYRGLEKLEYPARD
jgi:putative transposase